MTAKVLVVDACVARAAGEKTDHPVSTNCCSVLKTILDCGQHIKLHPELRTEWNEHMSRFSRTWLTRMFARRRVDDGTAPCPNDIEPAVRKRVRDKEILAAVMKDLHLVCGAIASDSIVISCDDKAREHMLVPAKDVAAIGDIMWESPCIKVDNTLAWLEKGAPFDRSRCLAKELQVVA